MMEKVVTSSRSITARETANLEGILHLVVIT
jgi:hypothetical protein